MNIEKNRKHFWKIDKKLPNLIIALNKLGVSQAEINYFLNNPNLHPPLYYKDSFLLAPYDSTFNSYGVFQRCNWEYSEKWGLADLINRGYIYKGKIKITQEEIDAYNFNL